MATITINTNLASLTAQRNLSAATDGMNTAMERLSTGYKINSGADDAAGSAVSTLMEAQISAYDVADSNAQMGISLLDTQEGVLDIIGDYLQRIRDLTQQAANGTYGTSSMEAIRAEVEQRMLEINRLCQVVDYNGIQLLDGTSNAVQSGEGVNLQVGNNATAPNVINLDSSLFASAMCTAIFFSGLGISEFNFARTGEEDTQQLQDAYADAVASVGGDGITAMCKAIYTNDSTARQFIYFIDDAIENISDRRTLIGAYMNRVESAVDALSVQKENIVSSNSSIKDADVATEASNYIKYQILQQSAATLLSTANQTPSIALNLV